MFEEWEKKGKSSFNGASHEEFEQEFREKASAIMNKWFEDNSQKFGYKYEFEEKSNGK
nr:MAG TPA: hypothetical protein [Caudoviricetes sp.]